jgi:hypothetical protein
LIAIVSWAKSIKGYKIVPVFVEQKDSTIASRKFGMPTWGLRID